ncbi:MAG: YneF family protein [Streptococcaceae bacterium]|jgi:uncharacterized protein YneF (UPF0154 family)|nr:YneF family protein [Streptococcaceae bacterium]
MSILFIVLLVILGAMGGFAGGLFLSRRQVKKMLIENPPLNEDAVRTMMSSMGRKPSETQVQQVLRQIRAGAKQADKKK